ncbi:MAG: hypothetical protein HOY76_33530 [Streptomyces sp.]|nr:hypothetical protein [Streptomyces sp.]
MGHRGAPADLLAELAADFVTAALETTRSAYVAVTAVCEGARATISVIPATAPAPTEVVAVPYRDGIVETAWGQAALAPGLCRYAIVNLLDHRGVSQ